MKGNYWGFLEVCKKMNNINYCPICHVILDPRIWHQPWCNWEQESKKIKREERIDCCGLWYTRNGTLAEIFGIQGIGQNWIGVVYLENERVFTVWNRNLTIKGDGMENDWDLMKRVMGDKEMADARGRLL